KTIADCISIHPNQPAINVQTWFTAQYKPTPTIIEAAQALYAQHEVTDIAQSGAGKEELGETTNRLNEIIEEAKNCSHKTICFVTGVPGAGKTLVGLKLATSRSNKKREDH